MGLEERSQPSFNSTKETSLAKSLLRKVHLKATSLNWEEFVIATNAKSDGLKVIHFKVMGKE